MKLQKWIASFVAMCVVATTVLPYSADAASERKERVGDTKEWIIENLETIDKQGSEADSDDIPTYSKEEMESLSWEPFEVETVIEMIQELDRHTLQLASYAYPKLRKLLSNQEKAEQNTWNDETVRGLLQELSDAQRNELLTYAPAVFTFEKPEEPEVFKEEETNDGMMNITATSVQYTEGQMAQYYTKTYTGKPVDDFYRAASLVETDLALSGKNGMDLVIQRRYHELDSKRRELSVEYDDVDEEWNNVEEKKLFKNRYVPFATGWSFNIPTFEYFDEVATEEVVYSSGKVQYHLAPKENEAGNPIDRYVFHLEDGATLIWEDGEWVNYPYEGATLIVNDEGRDVELIINGYRYTFDRTSSELIVTKRNAFGDRIRYHMDRNSDEGYAVEIEDTYGRFVVMEQDEAEGIKNLKLYKNESDKDLDKPIQTIEYTIDYNNDSSPEDSSTAELTSVEQEGVTIATYTYERRDAEYNLISDYTFDEDDDSFEFESDDYWDMDNAERESFEYQLLRSAHYPINGLTMTYYYSLYEDVLRARDRGVVRLYQDDHILSYISYPPVEYVDFTYIPYGKTEEELMYTYEYGMKSTWEIWKKPKTWWAHRLIHADERNGDIVSTIEYDSYGHGMESTFVTDENGNHLLKRVRTESRSDYPELLLSDGSTTYHYNPVQYTTYAYHKTKPVYQFDFMEGVPNETVRTFLMDPKVNSDGSLDIGSTTEALLPNFANITTYTYNEFGDITETVEPSGIETEWAYESFTVWDEEDAYRPVRRVTQRSADGSIDETTSYAYNADMLVEEETIERTYPTSTGDRTDTIVRTFTYNEDDFIAQIQEEAFSTDPAISEQTVITTFDRYDDYGHATSKTIQGVNLGNQTSNLGFTFSYLPGRDLLQSQGFPDGSSVQYLYDDLDRLTVEYFIHGNDNKAVGYTYDDTLRKVTKEVYVNRFNPLKFESFSLILAFSYASSLLQPPRSLGRKTPSVKEIT